MQGNAFCVCNFCKVSTGLQCRAMRICVNKETGRGRGTWGQRDEVWQWLKIDGRMQQHTFLTEPHQFQWHSSSHSWHTISRTKMWNSKVNVGYESWLRARFHCDFLLLSPPLAVERESLNQSFEIESRKKVMDNMLWIKLHWRIQSPKVCLTKTWYKLHVHAIKLSSALPLQWIWKLSFFLSVCRIGNLDANLKACLTWIKHFYFNKWICTYNNSIIKQYFLREQLHKQ